MTKLKKIQSICQKSRFTIQKKDPLTWKVLSSSTKNDMPHQNQKNHDLNNK